MRRVLAVLMSVALLGAPLATAQSGCVIPGATTVTVTANFSPLAADTGKTYWNNCATTDTMTLPGNPAPTAVWRIWVRVVGTCVMTISAGSGATLNTYKNTGTYYPGAALVITTDGGSNYYVASDASYPVNLGILTYNSAGTTTFAAAGLYNAAASVTVTHSTSSTLSPTGLVAWGSYVIEIKQDSTGGGVTLTLGTAGSCSAWKVGGGGSGAITLSTTASAIDVLAFTFDGTNCVANFRTNFN